MKMDLDPTYSQSESILRQLGEYFRENVHSTNFRVINSNEISLANVGRPTLEVYTPNNLVWRFTIRDSKIFEETFEEDGRFIANLADPEFDFDYVANWFYKDYYEFLAMVKSERKITDN